MGVVVLDARTGRLESFNREVARIAERLREPGQSFEALLGELTLRRADGREMALDEYSMASSLSTAETVHAEEVVLSVPDGRSVTTLVNSTAVRGEDGAVVSVVVTMQDLAPLEELERQRTEFLSLVGHELRLPLSAIKGAAATVLAPEAKLDPVETREFFRIVDGQADQMRDLIADLLDAGRIETGTLSVSAEPSAVALLVDRARATFLTAGGRHPLRIDVPPDIPPVMADRQRVAQVLGNLLANAARHSPESSEIRIEAVREAGFVAVSVADEGAGVPGDRLGQLFRKHAAAQGARGSGTGLGLAICKGLVEAHGGRIRAESPGAARGTRVTFTLPVAADGVQDATGAVPGGVAAPGRERILILDDDPMSLHSVRTALADAGYAPIGVADPAELGDAIRTERPRLVLMDLMLPDADGIELMGRIPELSDLPVIFISVYGRDETVARALDAGAADYVVKPFSPTELVARVRAALRARAEPECFRLGDLTIRYEERRATLAGEPLVLTPKEYELLRVLSTRAGRVQSYETLLRLAWSGRHDSKPQEVRTYVKKLRRKLGDDPARPVYIQNERGVGYLMPRPGERPATGPAGANATPGADPAGAP